MNQESATISEIEAWYIFGGVHPDDRRSPKNYTIHDSGESTNRWCKIDIIRPGREYIFLNLDRPLDELYFLGCADSGSAVWCERHYHCAKCYLETMQLIAASQYATPEQVGVARKIIDDLKKREKKTHAQTERAKMKPSLRYGIIERDGFMCKACGRNANDDVKLVVDHIVPVSKGGKTCADNLQTLCEPCNRGKGARHPDNPRFEHGETPNLKIP